MCSIISYSLKIVPINIFQHCVKSVQIRSFFWVRIFQNLDPNVGKYGRGKNPYLEIFHAVQKLWISFSAFQSFCKRSEEKEDFCFLTLSFDTCSFRIVSTSFSTNSRSLFHALNFTLRIKAKLKLLSEVIKKLPKYHVGAYLG